MFPDQRCVLTAKDHAILETMLDRDRGEEPAYSALLRHKLRTAEVCLRDDVDPGVATVNSRLTYRVGAASRGPHLLVQAGPQGLPDFAISIRTLLGLALLGAREGEIVLVPTDHGVMERVRLEQVLSQPEAESRDQMRQGIIVPFSIGAVGLANDKPDCDGPGDDDPGPIAA